MFKLSILFCCFVMALGRVEMIQSDVQILKEHPMDPTNVTSDELTFIISEEWMKMVASCFPNLDPMASISASFDYSLMGTNTLAWASSTMLLLNDVWQPALTNTYYTGNDFLIGVNPLPPNGWHVGPMVDDCSGISYRYDLRTVLRHEMMHGIGVGSSFRSNSLGYTSNGKCYPTKYDTMIEDSYGNKVVDGCTVAGSLFGKNVYINGVRLYNPSNYMEGSSLSHHAFAEELMYWRLSPSKCTDIGKNELKILSGIGVDCPNHPQYSRSQRIRPHLWPLLVLLLPLLYDI